MGHSSMSTMSNKYMAVQHHRDDKIGFKKNYHIYNVEPLNANQQEEIRDHKGCEKCLEGSDSGHTHQKPRVQSDAENKNKHGKMVGGNWF